MRKYLIENIKINIDDLEKTRDREAIIKKLGLTEQKVKDFHIERKSLDARKRNTAGIFYVYSAVLSYPVRPKARGVRVSEWKKPTSFSLPRMKKKVSPVVVGSGPAGLFAALYLAKMGYSPLVIERGKDIKGRVRDVNSFFETGRLDTDSNVQFGLGGAGTFSDGKLNSRIKDPLKREVLETFVSCGAPKEILYLNKPHLGTDRLRVLVEDLRALIEYHGGSFAFESRLTDLVIKDGKVRAAVINDEIELETDCVILAVGNGARDTFRMLERRNVAMTSKPFAVGFRVEHLRQDVDRFCYSAYAGHPVLGAADYNITFNDPDTGKGVYSFCNCPGGVVVAGASQENRIVTNGMSFSGRNMTNTNSAIVVNVNDSDYGSGVLDGMKFQERLEEKAFELGGGGYVAPCMKIGDYLGIPNAGTEVVPTYRPGCVPADLTSLLDERLTGAIRNSIRQFSEFFHGFENGMMTGPETRTSSPVRILRNKTTLESENVRGLYPVGEGAGYAGGILSSAVDGIKAAVAVNEN